MSYLAQPRISFFGRFLSDVSTRNNVNANYRPDAVQENQWNPAGGAGFELLDCRAVGLDGIDPDDPAKNLVVTGAVDQPSAKMVDLDPDWQFSSELWGLRLRVVDPGTGEMALEGRFEVAAFRDLWQRQIGNVINLQPSGGRYVSVLMDVEWGPAADRSAHLCALRRAAPSGKLSVGVHQFGYFYASDQPRYRTGTVAVHIGPYKAGDPKTVLVHRRINGLTVQGQGGRPITAFSEIDVWLSPDKRHLAMDLGHALPVLDVDGTLASFSALGGPLAQLASIAVGPMPDPEPPLFAVLSESEIETLAEFPTTADWYRETGGVLDVAVPADMAERVAETRLAVFGRFADGQVLLLAAETADGIFFRADHFVHRMEADESATTRIYARKLGEPLVGLTLKIAGPWTASAHFGGTVPEPLPAGIDTAVEVVTGPDGVAELTLSAGNPGDPRAVDDLDGQILVLGYAPSLTPAGRPDLAGTGLGFFDCIIAHVRTPYPVPDAPEFHQHIQPIMAQYAQLYPIMSQHLFDIADYDALVQNRSALLFAFGRSIDDPNYMPVTRDLSAGRMATLIKWLSTETGDLANPLRRDPASAPPHPLTAEVAAVSERHATTPDGRDAKTAMGEPLRRTPNTPVMSFGEGEV